MHVLLAGRSVAENGAYRPIEIQSEEVRRDVSRSLTWHPGTWRGCDISNHPVSFTIHLPYTDVSPIGCASVCKLFRGTTNGLEERGFGTVSCHRQPCRVEAYPICRPTQISQDSE